MKTRRLIALLLSMVMCFSVIAPSTFALADEEVDKPDDSVVVQKNDETPENIPENNDNPDPVVPENNDNPDSVVPGNNDNPDSVVSGNNDNPDSVVVQNNDETPENVPENNDNSDPVVVQNNDETPENVPENNDNPDPVVPENEPETDAHEHAFNAYGVCKCGEYNKEAVLEIGSFAAFKNAVEGNEKKTLVLTDSIPNAEELEEQKKDSSIVFECSLAEDQKLYVFANGQAVKVNDLIVVPDGFELKSEDVGNKVVRYFLEEKAAAPEAEDKKDEELSEEIKGEDKSEEIRGEDKSEEIEKELTAEEETVEEPTEELKVETVEVVPVAGLKLMSAGLAKSGDTAPAQLTTDSIISSTPLNQEKTFMASGALTMPVVPFAAAMYERNELTTEQQEAFGAWNVLFLVSSNKDIPMTELDYYGTKFSLLAIIPAGRLDYSESEWMAYVAGQSWEAGDYCDLLLAYKEQWGLGSLSLSLADFKVAQCGVAVVNYAALAAGTTLTVKVRIVNPEDATEYIDLVTERYPIKPYTISFDANGGEGSIDAINDADGDIALQLPANTFTREGYEFAGWATTENGEKAYNDMGYIKKNSDTTLYAVWNEIVPAESGDVRVYDENGTFVQGFATVQAAIDAVPADSTGYTVKIMPDSFDNGIVTLAETLTLNKSFTLDLNGATLTKVAPTKDTTPVIKALAGDATIKNGSITYALSGYTGTGSTSNANVINVGMNMSNGVYSGGTCDLTLSGVNVSATFPKGKTMALVYVESGKLTVDGSTLSANNVAGNTSAQYLIYTSRHSWAVKNPYVTISGNTILATNSSAGIHAIWLQNAADTLYIKGDSVKIDADATWKTASWSSTYSYANAINNQDGATVTVEGGKFTGKVWQTKGVITVSGGLYSYAQGTTGQKNKVTLAEGYEYAENTDPATKDAYPYVVRKIVVADAAGVDYDSADEAIIAVTDGTEITIKADTTIGGVPVPADSTVTVTSGGTAATVGGTTVTPKTVTITKTENETPTTQVVEALVVGNDKVVTVTKDNTVAAAGKDEVSDFVDTMKILANAAAAEENPVDVSKLTSMTLSLSKETQESSTNETVQAVITGGGKAFEVHPVVTITVEGEEPIVREVLDAELATNAAFTFTLSLGDAYASKTVVLTHYGTSTEVLGVFTADANGVVSGVTLSSFSVVTAELAVASATVSGTTTYYDTLADAIDNADEGTTVTLLADVTLAEPMNVTLGDKAITLDLGGHTLTGRTNLKSGSLTIQNGTVAGGSLQALNVYGSADSTAENYSVLTIASDVTVTADQFGVCLFGVTYSTNGYGAVINIEGTVQTTGNGSEGAVFVSGNLGQNVAGDAHNVINVTGSITSETDAAIALNGLATVNVQSGATVTGNTAIAVKRGTLNVTGGTITATGTKNYPGTPNHNGTEMTGAAISVTDTYNNYGALGVNISGGTITSTNADAVYKKEATYPNAAAYAISGGSFSQAVPLDYCAEGYIPAPLDTTTNMYPVTGGSYVAAIDNGDGTYAGYETLGGAISNAPSGGNVVLLADYTMTESATENSNYHFVLSKSLTIDGQGHTLTTSKNRGFNLGTFGTTGKALSFTFKDVTIKSASKKSGTFLLRIGGNVNDVTLQNVVLDDTPATGNTQPITIYAADGVSLTIDKCVIDARTSGYPIIDFTPATVSITDSTLKGYCALYFKNGSDESTYTLDGCTLDVPNDFTAASASSFGVIVFENCNGNTVTLKDTDIVFSTTNTAYNALLLDDDSTNTLILYSGNKLQNYGEHTMLTYDTDNNLEIAADTVIAGDAAGLAAIEEQLDSYGYELSETSTVIGGVTYYGIEQLKVAAIYNGETLVESYTSLDDAIEAVTDGGTITLLHDVNVGSGRIQVESKNYTVDLNGYTLSSSEEDNIIFRVYNGKTITIDGTTAGSKMIGSAMIPGSNAVGHIVVNGGTYENDLYTPFYANGTCSANSTISITNATIIATDNHNDSDAETGFGMYIAGPATVAVSGSTITAAKTGIEIRAGSLTSTGNTITAYGNPFSQTANGNGGTVVGAAIAVSQHNTNKPINVTVNSGSYTGYYGLYEKDVENAAAGDAVTMTIKGGTFTGTTGAAVSVYDVDNEAASGVSMAISGGTFSSQVPLEYCADNYMPTTADETTFLYTVLNTAPVAMIETAGADTQYFASLADAVAGATAGDTITVIADDHVSFASEDILRVNKNLTITGLVDNTGKPLYTIYGNASFNSNAYHEILISGADTELVTISNLNIKEFGNESRNISTVAPIWVSGSYSGHLVLDNVTVSDFNRQGIIIQGGSFEINNCTVICNKEKTSTTGDVLNKGIEVDNTSTGIIKNTTILGVHSTYDDWDGSGIEYWGANPVTVDGCTIEAIGSCGGISINRVTGYPGLTTGTITVKNTTVTAEEENGGYCLSVMQTSDSTGVLAVQSGSFTGMIEMENGGQGKYSISGGSFSNVVLDEYCAEGYIPCTLDTDPVTYSVKQGFYVAQIGNVKYETLAEAIAAVPANGTETTITMLADSAEEGVITIAATKNVTLDLAGFTVSYTTNDKSVYFITNNGTFTVQDTSDNADGKILLTAQPDTGYSVETVTVYNLGGTLNLDSGIIENATAGGLAYAVNNSSNAWGTPVVSTFNMTGGILRGANTDNTLRVYQNSSMTQTSTNIVNISGGTIENGIFVDTTIYQPTSAYTGSNITVDINISGGTINGLVDLKLRHGFNTSLDITGGDFTNAQIWVRKKANEWNANVAEPTEPIVSISGGKFSFAAGKAFGLAYDCAASEWTRYSKPYVVTGGVFNVDLNNYAGIAFEEGSMGVDNTNAQTMVAYPYTVEHFVASITSGDPATTIYYHTLAEAVAAAENGDEIVMIANSTENVLYDVTSPNLKNKTIAISGEYALTSPSGNFGFYFGNYDGGNRPATDVLTVSDITMTKSGGNYTTLFDGVTADLTGVTVNGDGNTALSYANGAVGTLTNVTVTNTGNHSQTWRNTALALQGIGAGPSVVTVKSGTYTSANGYAVYMFSSGGIVNIEGGTFSGALMAQIDNKTYPGNYATINISGGTFTNCTLTESGGENAQIYISGGYFSVDPTAYLVAGYTVQVLTSNATGADLAAYEAGAIYKVVPSDDVIVIFNAHGGKFADASITKNVNVVNDVVPEENMPANPTRLGYTFAGWYASENEGETLSDTAFDFTAPITEEVTVYAKWEGDANYFFNSGMRAYTTSSLNESINLNLYIEHLPEGTEMTDYSVRVTFNGSTTTFAYSAADATKVAGTYRHMLADVYAYQMTFPITFTLLYNNEVEIFTTSDYSVKDYMLYRSNAGDATDKEKTLMKAALDYGAVAQQYFASRYETDAEHLANATTNPYNVIEVARPTQTSEFYNSIASLTAFKSSMVYDSVNYIRIRIGDSQDLEGIEFSLEGDGFAMTEPVWEETNGLWMIQVSGLTSPKLGDEFTLTMTKGGQSTIFTYSAYAYANYMWDDAVDGRLSQALVAYGDAAKAFFGN